SRAWQRSSSGSAAPSATSKASCSGSTRPSPPDRPDRAHQGEPFPMWTQPDAEPVLRRLSIVRLVRNSRPTGPALGQVLVLLNVTVRVARVSAISAFEVPREIRAFGIGVSEILF